MRAHRHFGRHGHGPGLRPGGFFHRPFWGPGESMGGCGCLIGLIPLLVLALMLFKPH